VLVVVEQDAAARPNLEKLRDLVTDLQLSKARAVLIRCFRTARPGARQIAGGAVSVGTAAGPRLRQVIETVKSTRSSAASCIGRRLAGADRALAGAIDCRKQRTEKTITEIRKIMTRIWPVPD